MAQLTGKKPPGYFSLFPFNKQKRKHKPEWKSVTSWTHNLWKASLCPAVLSPVPEVSALRKVHDISLLASFKAACIQL
jgi:hypothetical protein